MQNDFTKLDIRNFYSKNGSYIFDELVVPLLENSVSYDRLTGYFSVASLSSIAQGLDRMFKNGGHMRLVIGIHDVPQELLEAVKNQSTTTFDVVELYKKRFLNEIDFLVSETERDAIATVGWMIKLGFMEVKVAAPINGGGIYHQKRMIFHDSLGNIVCGSGSLNETFGGRRNKEEMLFLFSWMVDANMMKGPLESFESIWNDEDEDIELFNLDEVFASEILNRLDNPSNPFSKLLAAPLPTRILEISRNSLSFSPYNLTSAVLYPHQERVFKEALDRWPVRVMLSDEVGLGKTLEAGAIISYLVKRKNVGKVVLLTPASLMRQWQDEMKNHFNLDFFRLDSTSSQFVSTDGLSVIDGISKAPSLSIISAQWARLNFDYMKAMNIELLILDEAHAARINQDAYGDRKTHLYRLMEELKERTKHLLLLTATPMQVQPREYHGLLELIGLPNSWVNFENFELGLRYASGQIENMKLDEAATLGKMIKEVYEFYNWIPTSLSEPELKLLMEIKIAGNESQISLAQTILDNSSRALNLFIRLHPANLLTCRNTKSSLEKYGYKFPERIFTSPLLEYSAEIKSFETALSNYLSTAYGLFEQSLRPNVNFPIAFAKSTYFQRLASSLTAASASLSRRLGKLNSYDEFLKSETLTESSDEWYDDDSESVDAATEYELFETSALADFGLIRDANKQQRLNIGIALQGEILQIKDCIERLNRIGSYLPEHDPKFIECLRLLESRKETESILVFSRYADTLQGFISLFEDRFESPPGYALYSGSDIWISSSDIKRDANKTLVTNALNSGEIKIVFCTDAASEGLNLQRASRIINLDVPWNPARLEQRIGRIARLGQKADTVEIVNLWYPGSIEADMYSRLLSRRDVYQIAVGEFPEIFSRAISTEVALRLNTGLPITSNAIDDLQNMRLDIQRQALEEVWKSSDTNLPHSKEFRQQLIAYLEVVLKVGDSYSLEPGLPHSLSLIENELLKATQDFEGKVQIPIYDIYCVVENGSNEVFLAKRGHGKFSFIKQKSLGNLLLQSTGYPSLTDEDFFNNFSSIEEALGNYHLFLAAESLRPDHALAHFPQNVADNFIPVSENLEAFLLGSI